MKATVDLADLLGLYFALNSIPGKGHAKILTAAIGWASAEVNKLILNLFCSGNWVSSSPLN